jgi:DNA-binding MurR/RpiR family transcriptional regulator
MSKPLPTPSTFDSLQKAIVERFPSLSKRLQQIATYALDNPSDLALETIATVAERANVQPSSLIRFAKELGFSGYSEMQRVFRLRLTDAMPDYNERLRTLRSDHAEEGEDMASLLQQFVKANIVGLECLAEQRQLSARLERAVSLIAGCDTVFLVAHRRSFPVCAYLSYAMSQLGVRNVLVDGVGGMFFQQAGHASPGDVLLAVSSKTYSPEVVQVVRESAQRDVPVIAITDGPLSPLIEHAQVSFEVQDATVHMFRSLAVPMTLAITLVVALGRVLDAKRNRNPQNATSVRRPGSAAADPLRSRRARSKNR